MVDVAELRYRVGMVFQKPTPFPMSVFDNVAFGLRLVGGIRGAELKSRVESALRDAAIWDEVKDKLHADGRSLSGGQQQRLCIARAIAVKPEVLFARRADSGARSDFHFACRGNPAGAAREVLYRGGHAQFAAGGAGVERHRIHVHGGTRGNRAFQRDIHFSEKIEEPTITLPGVSAEPKQ